jgi:hypothetical protein
MRKIHEQILQELQHSNPSIHQLSTTLNYNHNGIRGRTSELRKILTNYNIKTINHQYHLTPTLDFFKNHIITNHQTNQPLTISQLSRTFNTTQQSIETFLSQNFTNLRITQLSPTTIQISF